MPGTTPNLLLSHIAQAQNAKEGTFNLMADLLDTAWTNAVSVAVPDANVTLTRATSLGNMLLSFTGALTANRNIIVPAKKKIYLVRNSTTGGFGVVVKTQSGTGITVNNSQYVILYCDGTNVVLLWGSVLGNVFIALTDAPGSYSGAGGEAVEVNAGATGLQFSPKPCDILIFAPDSPFAAAETLARAPVGRAFTFPAGLTGSQATLINAATASTVFKLLKNGVQFGTITFAIGGTVGTFAAASSTSFIAGDRLELQAPTSADATAGGLGVTLLGTR